MSKKSILESINLELVFEAPSDDIISKLQGMGYSEFKRDNGVTASVFVPGPERRAVLQKLLAALPGATFNPTLGGSSLGGIEYEGGKIRIRPQGKTGNASAGLGNESYLIETLNSYIKQGIKTIEFIGANGRMLQINSPVVAHETGRKVANRSKSDVDIEDASGRMFPISLKMANADQWESADSYYGRNVPAVVNALVDMGKLELLDTGKNTPKGAPIKKLSKEIAKRCSDQEATDVVFGSDILGKGAVVVQTFADADFKVVNTTLQINCKIVIFKLSDIPADHFPYFLIRNNASRNAKGGIPGLRALVVTSKRANQGSNRVVIED